MNLGPEYNVVVLDLMNQAVNGRYPRGMVGINGNKKYFNPGERTTMSDKHITALVNAVEVRDVVLHGDMTLEQARMANPGSAVTLGNDGKPHISEKRPRYAVQHFGPVNPDDPPIPTAFRSQYPEQAKKQEAAKAEVGPLPPKRTRRREIDEPVP